MVMAEAKPGDKVKVHYRGSLEDGKVFDASHGGQPLEFTIGEGQVIRGFERAVVARVDDDSVPLDVNHPLAGKDLTFDIELVEIDV
jgi:peptidylprolyl isomerase